MDDKNVSSIKKFSQKLINKTFSDEDVALFFINVREAVSKDSELRELCDFIAHRTREKGRTYEYIIEINEYLNNNKTGEMNV